MATMAPERSQSQRLEALRRANEIRVFRAQTKREVSNGRLLAWDVVLSKDPLLETMKVADVLMAVPQVGGTKLSKVFTKAKVSPSKTIGGIHRGQLAALREQLVEYPAMRRAVFGVG